MKLTFSGYANFDGHGHRMSFSKQRLRQNIKHFTDLSASGNNVQNHANFQSSY